MPRCCLPALIVAVSLLSFSVAGESAEILRCPDGQGHYKYQDKPCSNAQRQVAGQWLDAQQEAAYWRQRKQAARRRQEVEFLRLQKIAQKKRAAEDAIINARYAIEAANIMRRLTALSGAGRKCTLDLECWADKNKSRAYEACAEPIERLAPYGAHWIHGLLRARFEFFRWGNPALGTVIYEGDQIEFRNTSGILTAQRYACEYDPTRNIVIWTEARPVAPTLAESGIRTRDMHQGAAMPSLLQQSVSAAQTSNQSIVASQ